MLLLTADFPQQEAMNGYLEDAKIKSRFTQIFWKKPMLRCMEAIKILSVVRSLLL